MSEVGNEDKNQQPKIKFGLLIKKEDDGLSVLYENHGVNLADVVLIIEACLERVKKEYNDLLKGAFGD